MNVFAQLAKYDETTGYFEAVAASEAVDRSGEVFDFVKSKPHFIKWSETVSKASGGKSLGNVREMHGKVAAGKLTSMVCDDDSKSIKVAGFAIDPVTKTKLASGVLTGVSIGGSYVSKWEDPALKGVTRYEATPTEISLVDFPCNPDAHFTLVKDGGVEELSKFAVSTTDAESLAKWYAGQTDEVRDALAKIAKRPDVNPKEGEKKYGDVEYADPKNKKYPIDDEEHIRAAWKYINKASDADKYSASDVKEIKARIVAAWKEKIDKDGPPSAEKADSGNLSKEEQAMNEELQKAHDEAKAELAKVSGELAKTTTDLTAANDSLAKVTGERDDLTKAVKERDDMLVKAAAHIEARTALIEKMKDQPEALKIALSSFGKGEDTVQKNQEDKDKVLKADGTVDEAATAIRKALRNPVVTR